MASLAAYFVPFTVMAAATFDKPGKQGQSHERSGGLPLAECTGGLHPTPSIGDIHHPVHIPESCLTCRRRQAWSRDANRPEMRRFWPFGAAASLLPLSTRLEHIRRVRASSRVVGFSGSQNRGINREPKPYIHETDCRCEPLNSISERTLTPVAPLVPPISIIRTFDAHIPFSTNLEVSHDLVFLYLLSFLNCFSFFNRG